MKLLVLFVINGYAQDIRGQQVGRELNSPEPDVDGTRERLGEGGFTGSGGILQQDMPTADKSGQQFPQGRSLPPHHLADVVCNPLNRFCRGGNLFFSHGSPLSEHQVKAFA